MKKISLLFVLLLACSTPEPKHWSPLLDETLSQWDTYLSYRHQPGYNGALPVDEQGNEIEAVGLNNDEAGVFTVVMEHDEPILRVSGEIYGAIISKQEFENYHLTLSYKWGDKKWPPREHLLKDSGVLYNSVGEPGVDWWRAWMLSQEFQIMEGHVGDYWSIANSAIDIRAFIPEGIMNPVASVNQPWYSVGAGTGNDGFVLRSADYESNKNEWTTIELISFGDKSLHIVNGHIVMVLKNSRYFEEGEFKPLVGGKIQIQSEAGEIFYKNIQIKSIESIPVEYRTLFN